MSSIDIEEPAARAASRKLTLALVTRLHFLAGLFIGPFIFLAALTGLLYALAPQLESSIYQHLLFTQSRGVNLPLVQQLEAARDPRSGQSSLAAVRPSPGPGMTTRVMFASPGLDASEHWAVFVDPVTADVVGEVVVYGTTGVPPLRNWLGDLHRRVFLGDWGRLYSALAASWLWLVAIGGVIVWRARVRQSQEVGVGQPRRTLQRWHSACGLCLLVGMWFFSALATQVSGRRRRRASGVGDAGVRRESAAADPVGPRCERRRGACTDRRGSKGRRLNSFREAFTTPPCCFVTACLTCRRRRYYRRWWKG